MSPLDASAEGKSQRGLPHFVPLAVVVAGLAAFAAYALWSIRTDPDIVMLAPKDGAEWMTLPVETDLTMITPTEQVALFRARISIDRPGAIIDVAAFQRVIVYIDRESIYSEDTTPEFWNRDRRVVVPDSIEPGVHTLVLAVTNDWGLPAVRATFSDLHLAPGSSWRTSLDGRTWTDASPVSSIEPPDAAASFPSPIRQLTDIAPLLTIVCLAAGIFSWRAGAHGTIPHRVAAALSPARLRFIIMAALLLLGINTMVRAELYLGADALDHYSHLRWYTENLSVPRVEDGGQNFQAPLFYMLAGAFDRALSLAMDRGTVDRTLRMIPILCGLGLVELMFRMLRRALPGDLRTQTFGLLAGSFTPMLVYMTQFVSNEPLAAVLGAATVLALLRLVELGRAAGPILFASCGGLWGLAVLSKVSALALAPLVVLTLAYWCYSTRSPIRAAASRFAPFFAVFMLTCAWFFVVDYARYGKLYIGGWSPEVGFDWWQMPGYRTPAQYASFGLALDRPAFAGLYGFWDGIYAFVWFDTQLSGIAWRVFAPDWDYRFAESAVLWALLPTLAILIGATRALLPTRPALGNVATQVHFTRVVALWAVGTYGASVLAHSLSLPYYCGIKASYAMAALPSLAILLAWGVAPLLHIRAARAILHAWLVGWILLVYAGYWTS